MTSCRGWQTYILTTDANNTWTQKNYHPKFNRATEKWWLEDKPFLLGPDFEMYPRMADQFLQTSLPAARRLLGNWNVLKGSCISPLPLQFLGLRFLMVCLLCRTFSIMIFSGAKKHDNTIQYNTIQYISKIHTIAKTIHNNCIFKMILPRWLKPKLSLETKLRISFVPTLMDLSFIIPTVQPLGCLLVLSSSKPLAG